MEFARNVGWNPQPDLRAAGAVPGRRKPGLGGTDSVGRRSLAGLGHGNERDGWRQRQGGSLAGVGGSFGQPIRRRRTGSWIEVQGIGGRRIGPVRGVFWRKVEVGGDARHALLDFGFFACLPATDGPSPSSCRRDPGNRGEIHES